MSDVNQELAKALKLLSEQYEQQFSEMYSQIKELGNQIILLTESKSKNTETINGKTDEDIRDFIIRKNGKSLCVLCEHAKYSVRAEKVRESENIENIRYIRFNCLLDNEEKENLICTQFKNK